jgi:hypothetical protein
MIINKQTSQDPVPQEHRLLNIITPRLKDAKFTWLRAKKVLRVPIIQK